MHIGNLSADPRLMGFQCHRDGKYAMRHFQCCMSWADTSGHHRMIAEYIKCLFLAEAGLVVQPSTLHVLSLPVLRQGVSPPLDEPCWSPLPEEDEKKLITHMNNHI